MASTTNTTNTTRTNHAAQATSKPAGRATSISVADVPYGQQAIERNELEPWPNPKPERDYVIHFEIPEFTCLCPRSGYPDFATLVIDYVPGASVVELKSLKLYINRFRDQRISHEAVANVILDDLVSLLAPRWMRLVAEFNVRGNIKTTITAEQAQDGYAGQRPAYQHPTFLGI